MRNGFGEINIKKAGLSFPVIIRLRLAGLFPGEAGVNGFCTKGGGNGRKQECIIWLYGSAEWSGVKVGGMDNWGEVFLSEFVPCFSEFLG